MILRAIKKHNCTVPLLTCIGAAEPVQPILHIVYSPCFRYSNNAVGTRNQTNVKMVTNTISGREMRARERAKEREREIESERERKRETERDVERERGR